MSQGIFRHRSGRVIASGRLVLAAVFLLAIWVDPSQPNQRPVTTYALLTLYVVLASALLILTWRNWWLDFKLAAPSHILDIAAFGALVFFTEGYTSPFYTFFVFLLLSAAIRWSWRETALTAVLVLLLYVIAGTAALTFGGGAFDLQRLLIRTTYLIVLSLVFVWFNVNQRGILPPKSATETELQPRASGPPIEPAVRIAAERLQAARILFIWSQLEEPWLNFTELDHGAFRNERIGPENQQFLLADLIGEGPVLFDTARTRALSRHGQGASQLRSTGHRIDPSLIEQFRLDQGLLIPVRAKDYEGALFVLGVDGMCADDLETAETIGFDIEALLDRSSMVAFSEEAAVEHARASLARDLHDSVVQVLAGASFRLEALKIWINAGKDADAEIEAMKADLAAEQRNVRSFIAGLRSGRGSLELIDLRGRLPTLVEQLCRQWNIECGVAPSEVPVEGPAWLEHELHQFIREAAANAVRHGKARSLDIALAIQEGDLHLTIEDDGDGLPPAGPVNGDAPAAGGTAPWSVNERVHALGGTLSLTSSPQGCRLLIVVPLGDGA